MKTLKEIGIWGLLLLFIAGILYGLYWLVKNWKNLFYGPQGTVKTNPETVGIHEISNGLNYMGVPVAVLASSKLSFSQILTTAGAGGLIWGEWVDVNGTSTFQPFASQAEVTEYMQATYGLSAEQVLEQQS